MLSAKRKNRVQDIKGRRGRWEGHGEYREPMHSMQGRSRMGWVANTVVYESIIMIHDEKTNVEQRTSSSLPYY